MTNPQNAKQDRDRAAQAPHAIDVSGLKFDYGGGTGLNLPGFRLESQDRAAVIGPSGSGKTTLLHLLAGLIRPTSGTVSILGQNLSDLGNADCDRFRGANIGIVFQGLHLLASLSVRQNVLMAQRLGRRAGARIAVDDLLKQLGLETLAHRRPSELSFGQAQRVAVARAVAHGPRLILADEPTSALDDENAARVISLLAATAGRVGAALLVVTHDSRVVDHFEHVVRLESAP